MVQKSGISTNDFLPSSRQLAHERYLRKESPDRLHGNGNLSFWCAQFDANQFTIISATKKAKRFEKQQIFPYRVRIMH